MCFDHCTDNGAAFMATQWGFECWCSSDGGLDYNRHYEMMGDEAVCDMPCMGDKVRYAQTTFSSCLGSSRCRNVAHFTGQASMSGDLQAINAGIVVLTRKNAHEKPTTTCVRARPRGR